jgi:hypothetical protein
MHRQVVHGAVARFGEIFRTRAVLRIEDRCDVANLHARRLSSRADLDDAVARGHRGDDRVHRAADPDATALAALRGSPSAWPTGSVASQTRRSAR